ncbi:unnamed protein product [Phytomonas sp. EM1]|nr:unnamed protein product [Phytomonas sp. EM1]|eukprot:CCW63055.1 unnamed protein product [Phytomonas sp. isolate EM1]
MMNPNAIPYKVTLPVGEISKSASVTSSSRSPLLRSATLTSTDRPRQLQGTKEQLDKNERHQLQRNQLNTPQSSSSVSSSSLDLLQQDQRTAVIRYTRAELLQVQKAVLQDVAQGPIVDMPPFKGVPLLLTPFLKLAYALEYIDVEASIARARDAGTQGHEIPCGVSVMATGVSPASVMPSSSPFLIDSVVDQKRAKNNNTHSHDHCGVRTHPCLICMQGCSPCPMLSTLLRQITQQLLRARLSACLLQSNEVVWAQLQLALVFEAKKSSLRMRLLAEKHPEVVRKVAEYLYGEGYHLRLPAVTAHDEWTQLMKMLKYDAIRDNATRIKTDLSKRWRRYHTPFEQFVFFFSFRDDRPNGAVRNVVTRSVKPGMVAILTGDLVAMYLLHKLGFFIPPDYYWEVFPFMKRSVGKHAAPQVLVRHFALYLSSKQCPDIYNPVENLCMKKYTETNWSKR